MLRAASVGPLIASAKLGMLVPIGNRQVAENSLGELIGVGGAGEKGIGGPNDGG